MLDIAKVADENGFTSYFAYPKSRSNLNKRLDKSILIGNRYTNFLSAQLSIITGLDGSFCYFATMSLVKKLEIIKPDIIHLHNIHGFYLNYKVLFRYLKKSNAKIIWTLHDCWSFTGKCPYYTIVDCNKWKTECNNCPQISIYPKSKFFDTSKYLFRKKKILFTSLTNCNLVTVSRWLKDQVEQSYLSTYKLSVIENGIDTNIFKFTKNNFREKYNIQDKFIILGVANPWSKRKGLDDFLQLSEILDSSYKIVLIGLTDEQIQETNKYNIFGLRKTNNSTELAEWYSTANVFFNASIEETFGLVSVEAMSCGTPIIAYNSTANPEVISETDNFIVDKGDIEKIKYFINEVKNKSRSLYSEKNISKVKKYYEKKSQYLKYLNLYKKILGE